MRDFDDDVHAAGNYDLSAESFPVRGTTKRKKDFLKDTGIDSTAAAAKLIRPITRWLISQGIPLRRFIEMVKCCYVQTAKEQFGSKGRPAANTRVEMLTGIDRKEVKRILEEFSEKPIEDTVSENQHQQNKITKVLTTWLEDPRYLQVNGEPRKLRLRKGKPNLTELVNKYPGEMTPSAVIEAMIKAKSIEKEESGYYKIMTRNYVPVARGREQILRYGSVLNDIAHTLNYNLMDCDPDKRLLERRVTERIPVDREREYRRFLERKSQAFIDDVDNWLAKNCDPEQNPDKYVGDTKDIRMGVGIYSIRNDNE